MGLFTKLLDLFPEPAFNIEREVKKCLASMSRCPATVVLASHRQSGPHYRGDVRIDSNDLFSWVRSNPVTIREYQRREQLVFGVLSIWLRDFDKSDLTPYYLPPLFVEILEPHIVTFLDLKTAKVFCPTCNAIYPEVIRLTLDEQKAGPYLQWTNEWRCPAGHIVYRRENKAHLHIEHRSPASDS